MNPSLTSRQRILSRIDAAEVDHLPLMPITMMFAADRLARNYFDYVTDYRVLVEAQLRVADEFGIDHVSTISDPAREAADCGSPVHFFPDQPPTPAADETQSLLADKPRLASLKLPDPLGGGRMHDRVRAAELFKRKVGSDKLIEGWVEGPCAQAADLRGINTLMLDFYDDPAFVTDLFDFVLEMETRFARAQLQAGVDLIGVGDAAASLVGPEIYRRFVWPYEKCQVDALHAMGARVRLHICGNTRPLLEDMGKLGCEIVDLDYPSPIAEGRQKMGPRQVLLGNLDPVRILKNGTARDVLAAVARCHQEAGRNYIVGAGCEIARGTPDENLRALSDYAQSHA